MRMAKPLNNFTVTFEFGDGLTQTYLDTSTFRGVMHEGKRAEYAVLQYNGDRMYITESDIKAIKYCTYVSIASSLSPGYIAGRVMVKPIWLHHIINNKG